VANISSNSYIAHHQGHPSSYHTMSLSPNDPLYTPPESAASVDLSKLSPQELKLYKLYGKLPKTNDILKGKLKDRKFFDSGDYAMSKARGSNANADPTQEVGILNPLQIPEIENVARINRNSVVGSNSIISNKSKLEDDVTLK